VHAATNPFAGTYSWASMHTSGPVKTRTASYGTFTVAATGALTLKITEYVAGASLSKEVPRTETHHGTVSTAGVITFTPTGSAKFNLKFISSGQAVLGFQGTFTNMSDGTAGIVVALRQP